MADLTREEIDTLDTLAQEATPGPWQADPKRLVFNGQQGPLMSYLRGGRTTAEGMTVSLGSERVADHEFVAAIVNAWPTLRDLARIGLDAGADWRERASQRCKDFAATGRRMMRDADRETHRNYFAQCLAADALAETMLALPSAGEDQQGAAGRNAASELQGESPMPLADDGVSSARVGKQSAPHQSAAAQDQSSEARRELAPLEQEDTERASPAKGHTPASAADLIPAAGQLRRKEQVEGTAPTHLPAAQPRGDRSEMSEEERKAAP